MENQPLGSHFLPWDVLCARCPRCRQGRVTTGFFSIRPRCTQCDYNFYPEPGFYLGAMMISFLATAMLTIPIVVYLKFSGADETFLVVFPFLEFAIIGPLLLYYARIIWLYLEFSMTKKLEQRDRQDRVDRH